jgi:phage-related protein
MSQGEQEKPLVWLCDHIRTPPVLVEGRVEAGFLLLQLQDGESLSMPESRPMPSIGPRCHELRICNGSHNWRVIYRIDTDAIIVAEVFVKTTQATPNRIIAICKARLRAYDAAARNAGRGTSR